MEGLQLSGGERQRLAVARALLADWQVLVVDEVTSALDGVTSDEVYDALRVYCAGKTLVIIAHRLPRIDPTDQVVLVTGAPGPLPRGRARAREAAWSYSAGN